MSSLKYTKRNRSLFGNLLVIVFLGFLGLFMLIPLVYVINNAFKPIEELFRFPPAIFVQNPTLRNFTDIFSLLNETNMSFWRYFFNTLLLTSAAAAGQIIFASLCAYAMAKTPYPGSKFIFNLIVFSLMFSPIVTQVPSFIIFAKLKLIDTYWGMIVPSLVSTMGFYLMKQFLQTNVPDPLLEAARIDGASELRVFFKIVLPLLKPAWMTLIILSIQNLWGATSSHTYSEVYKTLPQALAQLTVGGIERTGVSAAASLLMLLVPIGCFLLMQSKIVDTMGSAGLKG